MQKEPLTVVCITILFLGTCITPSVAIDNPLKPIATQNTLYVGGTGEGNYTKIQDAIDNASNRDFIFVYNGTYYEVLTVNKSITLFGEDKNNTIINGGVTYYYTIYVIEDGVHIYGFTITTKEEYGCGININANDTVIQDNILLNNDRGISLQNSHNSWIIFNIIISHNYSDWGISLYKSYDNIIARNNISISYYVTGITLSSSYNNTISYNIIKNNEWGLYVDFSNYNSFYNNLISQNYEYGIGVYYSNHNFIVNNIISKNIIGFDMSGSNHNMIYENNLFHNKLNAFFTNYDTFSRINIWKQNYWGRLRLLPKLILGEIIKDYGYITIPWINFDWHPAKEPYDIKV